MRLLYKKLLSRSIFILIMVSLTGLPFQSNVTTFQHQRRSAHSTLPESTPTPAINPTDSSGFQLLGQTYGVGALHSELVGPGKAVNSQVYYATYTYIDGTMDLVATNPTTHHISVYTSPARSEAGSWAIANGPDENIYIGTLPNAHILRFNPHEETLSDLGQVPPDPDTGDAQSYIWDMTYSASTNQIYACTYPSADLISYDPLSNDPQLINLGSVDPDGENAYARTCVADPDPDSPFIYIGLGSQRSQIVSYNLETQALVFRLSRPASGFGTVYLGDDGVVHGSLTDKFGTRNYLLRDGDTEFTHSAAPAASHRTFANGDKLVLQYPSITIMHPDKSTDSFANTYHGKDLHIWRIGSGPGHLIYGGTVFPYNMFAFHPQQPDAGIFLLGQAEGGQPYAMLNKDEKLYSAVYGGPPLQIFDPQQPFTSQTNPQYILDSGIPQDVRALAMVRMNDGMISIGAIASYGQLTGPLVMWNTKTPRYVQQYYPVTNEGIASLTVGPTFDHAQSSLIGGTTIYGGSGISPTSSGAHLFIWNVEARRVSQIYTIPNVPNALTITDLSTDPSTGYIYGIAQSLQGSYAFIFNELTGTFIDGGTLLPIDVGQLYNSAAIYQGKLWGLFPSGIFAIDLQNLQHVSAWPSPTEITAGFAMQDGTLYYASHNQLWSYTSQ